MGRVTALFRPLAAWYISGPALALLGVLVGAFVFFTMFPGKPKVGIIDIPFTVLTDDTAFVIAEFLDYTRREDDIKAVVIKLNSPGSVGAAGDLLYLETRKLREKKPVVIAMNDLVASGAFMWSMGANYTYAKPTSWVGSVGVFIQFFVGPPVIPVTPDREGSEFEAIGTGPQKLTGGGSRRDFLGILDQLKENFYQTVAAERGEKLQVSREEVLRARIYNGNEGVRLGLVDAIGGETDAIEKAAELAGISNYGLVDVNVEVARRFNEQLRRINEPLAESGLGAGAVDVGTLIASLAAGGNADLPASGLPVTDLLRRPFIPSGLSSSDLGSLEGLPFRVGQPKVYYLYVGPTQ